MVEATKKADHVDHGGPDKIEDSSIVYTVSSEEKSGHGESTVADHVEPGSERDSLGRSPAITECHKVFRVQGEAAFTGRERATAQGNDDRQNGNVERYDIRKEFHTEVGVPVTHTTKEAQLQVTRAVPTPEECTHDTDGTLQATLGQGNAMNPLGKLLAQVTLDAVESPGKLGRFILLRTTT
jgi:hypothetical protein